MAELVIKFQKYIGESSFNWDTFEFEMATSADDVRMAVEWAQYDGVIVDSILLEMGTCFGGSTIAGTEIYNYLQGLGIPVRTRILAFAASMATAIMLVGDEIECDQSTGFLVHGPSGGADGTVKEVESGLKMLTDTYKNLRDIYVARTGQPVEVVEEWMSKDTFFTAEEALAAGLVTKVIPIAPKAAPVLTDAQASARRAKFAGITARAESRFSVAAAAPAAALPSPSPTPAMATPAVKPTPRAAAPKTTPKPTAKKTLGQRVLAALGLDDEDETPTAEVQSTELDNGALLYHDGALAVDSAVYNDEALTEATADGDYDAKDGSVISVAAGKVTTITEATAEGEQGTEATASTADLIARIEKLEQTNAKLSTDLERFKATVPPTPQPRARAAGSPQGDVKNTAQPKAKGLLAGASKQD